MRDKKAKKQFRIRLGFVIHNTIKSLILTNKASRSTSKLRFRSNLTCCWLTLLSGELAYATGACVTQISYDPRSYDRNFCNGAWKPEKFRTSAGLLVETFRSIVYFKAQTSKQNHAKIWYMVTGLWYPKSYLWFALNELKWPRTMPNVPNLNVGCKTKACYWTSCTLSHSQLCDPLVDHV